MAASTQRGPLSPPTVPKLQPVIPAEYASLTHDTLHVTVPHVRFRHNGLRRLHERRDARGLDSTRVARIGRLLDDLEAARKPADMDMPGLRLHPLTGNRRGQWSVRVSDNWRIVFRFEDGEAVDVDLVDYH